MEHFGIVIVEAMAAGCIPLVFNGGGVTEIVDHKENGYAWDSEKELLDFTNKLLTLSEKQIIDMRELAAKKAEIFSKNTIDGLLKLPA